MHWLRSIVAMGVLLGSVTAFAEEQRQTGEVRAYSEFRNTRAITMMPVELFSGTLNIEYEQALASYASLYGGLNFIAFRGVLATGYDRAFVVGPEVGARFYLLGDAPAGLWIGPYLGASFVSNTVAGTTRDSFGWGAGAMAGINLIFFRRLMISLGAGTGWIDMSSSPTGYRVGLYGFVPRLRLAAGVAF